MTDIQTMPTPQLWTLAEETLRSRRRWHTARAALDELGLRLDMAFERLEHHQRGAGLMPTLDQLAPTTDELPSCYRPFIADRIRWVNGLVKQAQADAQVVGL